MKLFFPKLYRYERLQEHCAVGMPFPQGAFRESMRLKVLDDGKELPVQSRVTSRYADGSIRYLFVRTMVDLPAGRGKILDVSVVEDSAPVYAGLTVTEQDHSIEVHGGQDGLDFTVRDGSEHIVESLDDGRMVYDDGRFAGPFLKDADGNVWTPRFMHWRVTERGPLAAVLRCNGSFMRGMTDADAQEYTQFEARLTAYAHKPWVEVSFRLINATDGPMLVRSLSFALKSDATTGFDDTPVRYAQRAHGDSVGEGSIAAGKVIQQEDVLETTGVRLLNRIEEQMKASPVRCCVGSSNYKTNFTVSGGSPVERVVDTASLMMEANEHFPEVLYGTFFTDRTEPRGGVCATVFQAQQNYPKAVRSDTSGIYVMLVPENVEQVVFESGMSREQRFLLHFHNAEAPMAELDNRSLIYQMPDRPYLKPEVYADAGVCPDIFVRPENISPDVEIALIQRCDAHSRSYGMLNFGDAPDPGYTGQGRGKGMLVWTNNEYDFPHACALLYMRTGERRFLDYLIASANHWMDVDVCHYSRDPMLLGGQWEHSRRHVLDSCMVCSHQWVEGLLDLYHLTGEERALETALGIGQNIRRLLETPAYQVHGESNARETGWALRTLTALYVETSDPVWLEKAEWIVQQFREWADEYGGWIATYTDNTLIHVPFMIAVAMGSLYRYYQVRPSEEIRTMLLSAADDLIENCMTPTGLFVYKELPSLSRLGNNTMVLEALTIAYRLSGNVRYLRLGMPGFRRDLKGSARIVGEKKVVEGYVLLENDPPKHFAQSFIPMSVFYKAASEEGLLNM